MTIRGDLSWRRSGYLELYQSVVRPYEVHCGDTINEEQEQFRLKSRSVTFPSVQGEAEEGNRVSPVNLTGRGLET